MKKSGLTIVSVLLFCSTYFATAQVAPSLRITNDSPTSVAIDWRSEIGTDYRLLFTESIDVFSLWTPLQDISATSTNSSVSVASTETPTGFFKMVVLTGATGFPTARILSPTNGETVSGIISLRVGAQDDSQLMKVNLYMDDGLIAFLEAGELNFKIDTTHFTNGTHTFYAVAVDNSENETQSASVTANFENVVRWPDADSLFQDFVQIEVESDIFPANWTVFVEDLAGNTLRTFSGSTSDGLIQTNWDGLDNNSVPAPDEAAYRVTVVVTAGDSAMQSSSFEKSDTAETSRMNSHGATDYEVEEQAPDFTASYFKIFGDYLALTEKEKAALPPIPPFPNNKFASTITKKISARQMFLSQNEDAERGGSGSVSAVLWRENAWRSANILLGRQKITGFEGIRWDGIVASALTHIKNTVATAEGNLPPNNIRGVYQSSVFVTQNASDYTALTNNLKTSNPDIRAFYFWSHGSPDGNTLAGVIHAPDVANMLTNQSEFTSLGSPGKPYAFYKPFNFVFLDGCMTGNGDFPEAFGIPKTRGPRFYLKYRNVHPRAFMGWGGKVSNSILNDNFLRWTRQFWTSWLETPDETTLQAARVAADNAYPLPADVPLRIYGTPLLKWAD